MRFAQTLNLIFLDKLSKYLSQSKRVPDKRSSGQLISESVSSIDDGTKFDDICTQNIISDLWTHMKKDLEVSLTKSFFMNYQFC